MSDFLASVRSRRGHFRTESGFHSNLWMDLETLFRRPDTIRPFARAIADRLRDDRIDVACGAMNEGAFLALMVAEELRCDFAYAERFADAGTATLFPVRYTVPQPLRPLLAGRRIAIVNDVISAGSAVRGTYVDVSAAAGAVVVIAAPLVLGDSIDRFAAERSVRIEALAREPYALWTPETCPMCAERIPLND